MVSPRLAMVLALSVLGADAPDELWNGKPWGPGDLEGAVDKGDPEALAEMAYWMKVAWGDKESDERKVAEIETRPHAASSLMVPSIGELLTR